MNLFIGIDPGASGGIAFVPERGEPWALKMPETYRDILDALTTEPHYQPRAMIEAVHSMPGQGVASSFKFGENYGALVMALTASQIPFIRVTPQGWQKSMKCLTKGDKNVSKRRAQELFPNIKITHAIADALLIAEHLRQTWR